MDPLQIGQCFQIRNRESKIVVKKKQLKTRVLSWTFAWQESNSPVLLVLKIVLRIENNFCTENQVLDFRNFSENLVMQVSFGESKIFGPVNQIVL